MEEVAETSPKPEGQGAASAALLHLVPQRKFALPPVSDDRSAATLPRSWLGNSLSPAYRIPLSAGSRRRHNESLPANRKNRQWTDRRKRALIGSRKLSRRGTKGSPAAPASSAERRATGGRRGTAATGRPRPRAPTHPRKVRSSGIAAWGRWPHTVGSSRRPGREGGSREPRSAATDPPSSNARM